MPEIGIVDRDWFVTVEIGVSVLLNTEADRTNACVPSTLASTSTTVPANWDAEKEIGLSSAVLNPKSDPAAIYSDNPSGVITAWVGAAPKFPSETTLV